MNIKQTKKDGFDVYSFVYPAHRRTLKFVDRMIVTTSSQKFPDLYFIVLKKNRHLQALFAYEYFEGNFYSFASSSEICLPHKVYAKKDSSIIDVLDSFFLSKFTDLFEPSNHKNSKNYLTPHFSSYFIDERRYKYFPSLSLRELFNK